jgi:histidinol dehydrogenase
MIVCITHAKVGHRQAPYVVNKNPAHKAGFLLLGSGIAYRCNSGALSIPVEFILFLISPCTMLNIKRYATTQADFRASLEQLLAFEGAQDAAIENTVADILNAVKARGDEAVLEYTSRFDKLEAASLKELELSQARMKQALDGLPADQRTALEAAAARVRSYHERQVQQSWSYTEADGTMLGQQVTPLDRVGLYVPGGKAAYPSSVLMNAIPAKVAGVAELIMVVPTPGGQLNELVLAAAAVCGVDRLFTIGGAQAVGALAYGTQTVPQVDKIVGPGNAYVAAAKRRVFGVVGIDMVAGPSEILVICDGKTDPDWIAMDLFSQAEHDELAQAILLSPDAAFLDAVAASIARLLEEMPRKAIIRASLEGRGALIHVKNLDEAVEIANYIAPEHLELSVDAPGIWAKKIKHAGAIFMGRNTCEAMGDYCAGPNHVLPTSRTARFSSPLGVYDFQKRTSLIQVSAAGADELGKIAATLAYGEGLQAHARSAEFRIRK